MNSISHKNVCLINSYFNDFYWILLLLDHTFVTKMALLIIASFLVTYLYGQEITKTTMSCITETPEPTMRTVDKLKDTWDQFVKSYCEGRQWSEIITANFTPTILILQSEMFTTSQLKRLEKCDVIAHGKAIASARRICFQTMALPDWKKDPKEFTPQFLKQKWCDDMPYNARIEICLKNKIKTLPSSLVR